MSHLPIHSINVPNGGIQQTPPQVTSQTPIYSSYTGNFIQFGQIKYGTPCDAPSGHKNHGKNYHVIQYNEANDTFMCHGYRSSKKQSLFKN
jgi:hypothetical protein